MKGVVAEITKDGGCSGAYHSPSKLLTCAFFDRGVGIPATLPRTHRERLAGLLEKLRLPNSDASMIAAAMELGRTRTGLQHQGRGLADVQKFVEHSEKWNAAHLEPRRTVHISKRQEGTVVAAITDRWHSHRVDGDVAGTGDCR